MYFVHSSHQYGLSILHVHFHLLFIIVFSFFVVHFQFILSFKDFLIKILYLVLQALCKMPYTTGHWKVTK